jgi:hypothetical protein
LELFDFELYLYRMGFAAIIECLFLFDVPLDEQILDFGHPAPFLWIQLVISSHCNFSSQSAPLPTKSLILATAGEKVSSVAAPSVTKGSPKINQYLFNYTLDVLAQRD